MRATHLRKACRRRKRKRALVILSGADIERIRVASRDRPDWLDWAVSEFGIDKPRAKNIARTGAFRSKKK